MIKIMLAVAVGAWNIVSSGGDNDHFLHPDQCECETWGDIQTVDHCIMPIEDETYSTLRYISSVKVK